MTQPAAPDQRALLKRALDTIETLERRLESAERARHQPIAIVGMGVRFPGAETPDELWRLLHDGVDVVGEVPRDRWDVDAFYDPDPDAPGKSYTRWGAFIDGVDRFDAAFFGISPREAAAMDPQHRLLLEVAWSALEDAGRAGEGLAGSRTGVFVGMAGSDFTVLPRGDLRFADTYFSTGAARSIAAGRLSYALGLHGASLAVDTACSSSAVATHLAVQSLRIGDADMALAGGVNVMLAPEGSISTSRGRMMSFTGRCRTFDAAADGYVRAEGCAILVLRRLSDAIADGDRVLAVILGSAVNQDGRSNGITAPNAQAQEAVIRAALADAGVGPDDIGLVEAHGTGTTLGDPIEMRALAAVFAGNRRPERPLMVGSVKTNLGHTEGVAGTAGLVKLVLALRHGVVPPHLHLREPNPLIPWSTLPVTVPTRPTPWKALEAERLVAGVSSFGFSGTNSHIVVAATERGQPAASDADGPRVLTLSARAPEALRSQAESLADHLVANPDTPFADVAFTLNRGRAHLPERLALVADSVSDAAARLRGWASGAGPGEELVHTGTASAPPDVAFLFTGQGAQRVDMARAIMDSEPVFREAILRCDAILRDILHRPLLEVLYPPADARDEAERLIGRTAWTQPALFAVEYALARLWMSWGVQPAYLLGHSIGEYVAACIAGVFSLEDGLHLVAARGRLMDELPAGGAMASVFADERTVAGIAAGEPDLAVAAVNAPRNVVLSGAEAALARVLDRLEEQGIGSRRLRVSHAFHSPLVEPMLDGFRKVAESVRYSEPEIGIVSNLDGQLVGSAIATADYWCRHVRAAVRFADGVETLRGLGCTAYVEVGPGSTLLSLAEAGLGDDFALLVASTGRDGGDARAIRDGLARLYVHGVDPDWTALDPSSGGRRVALPTYPFQRRRHWLAFPAPGTTASAERLHPLVHERIRSPLLAGTLFRARIGVSDPPPLTDHRIHGVALLPAAAFADAALAAGALAIGQSALDRIEISSPLPLPEDGTVELQLIVEPERDGLSAFRIASSADGERWTVHAEGALVAFGSTARAGDDTRLDVLRDRIDRSFDVDRYYAELDTLGAGYGPEFRTLREIRYAPGEALGRLELEPGTASWNSGRGLHPGLLDGCLQLIGAATQGESGQDREIYVPTQLSGVRIDRPGVTSGWCHVAVEPSSPDGIVATVRLLDEHGEAVASIREVRLRRAPRDAIRRLTGTTATVPFYRVEWEAAASPAPAEGWAAGRWVVLGDGHTASALEEQILAAGGTCLRGTPAIDPEHPVRMMVDLRGVDGPVPSDADGLFERTRARLAEALDLVRAAGLLPEAPRVWLATRGAQSPIGSGSLDPTGAALWAFANAVAVERPAQRIGCIDLPADTNGVETIDALIRALAADDAEDRIALRDGERLAARLAPITAPASAGAGKRAALRVARPGVLDGLELGPDDHAPVGPGQVEIEVAAAGLNFRDVLNVLGMYPGDAGPLGSECAGTVVSVGSGVEHVQPGDRVLALAAGTFRTHVVADAHSVYPVPDEISLEQAAGLPLAYLTAYHGLGELAGLRAGHRVLVHAGTGGVGLAAVRIALRAGATVFATAGSDRKRAYLRDLGVHHVLDSRSLAFADEVRRITSGAGVDALLNSLADDFIPAGLGIVANGGIFLEIGKRGVWDDGRVASEFPGVRYAVFDLADVIRDDPAWMRAALDTLMPAVSDGSLGALPVRGFPMERAADAFRFMAQARHIGKLVLKPRSPSAGSPIRADGGYLVTGGTRGIGLEVAKWLAAEGAGGVALMARGQPDAVAAEAIERMQADGATVIVVQGDVASAADVRAALRRCEEELPTLRGVFHAAGILDDALLSDLTPERIDAVLRPKVLGGWHLHDQTQQMPLDAFVLFSAGAGTIGSAGQSNYAAANGFLDGLARLRASAGLPATAIAWGAWGSVGMAARLEPRERARWREHGIEAIAVDEGLDALRRAVEGPDTEVAALPVRWDRFLPALGATGQRPFFGRLRPLASNDVTDRAETGSAAGALARAVLAAGPGERIALVRAAIERAVRAVLALDGTVSVPPTTGFTELGMDSLMAVELANRLAAEVGLKLPTTLAFENPTPAALAEHLVELMAGGEPEAAGTASPEAGNVRPGAPLPARRPVDELSEEETEDTLLRALERAGY